MFKACFLITNRKFGILDSKSFIFCLELAKFEDMEDKVMLSEKGTCRTFYSHLYLNLKKEKKVLHINEII